MTMKYFMPTAEFAKETGLETSFIRTGCKSGAIPHIKAGTRYYINVPGMLKRMESLSAAIRSNSEDFNKWGEL